jgi:predicted nucleic acid-binding protein
LIIVDTSALFAFMRIDDPDNAPVSRALDVSVPLVVSPFVIAELDYRVETRIGIRAELAVLAELSSGSYELPALTAADLISCAALIERYSDQRVGITDASLVVLADRYQTRTICTLDRRHFSVLRTLDDQPFDIVP